MTRTRPTVSSDEHSGDEVCSVRRLLLSTAISLSCALLVGLVTMHGFSGSQPDRAAGLGSQSPLAAVAGRPVPQATATSPAAARPRAFGLVQVPDGAIPALALRALARTDTSATAPLMTFYIVDSQSDANDLEAGLAMVNALRATGGARALYATAIAAGPGATPANDALIEHWFPSQVVDLR